MVYYQHATTKQSKYGTLHIYYNNYFSIRKSYNEDNPKGILNKLTYFLQQIKKKGSLQLYMTQLAQRLECSPMAQKTWVQSQVESYQRL